MLQVLPTRCEMWAQLPGSWVVSNRWSLGRGWGLCPVAARPSPHPPRVWTPGPALTLVSHLTVPSLRPGDLSGL